MNFSKYLLKFTLQLILLFIILLAAHYFFIYNETVKLSITLFFKMHIFLFVITFISFVIVLIGAGKGKAGFIFLGMGLLKMMAAVAFLYPLIKHNSQNLNLIVLQFMLLYFIYLFWEAAGAYKLLKKLP